MTKTAYWTITLTAGIITTMTAGVKAANAETSRTILVPFTGVVRSVCYTQTAASSTAPHNPSVCDSHLETVTTQAISDHQDSADAPSSAAQPSSASSNCTTAGRMTIVAR